MTTNTSRSETAIAQFRVMTMVDTGEQKEVE